MVLDYRFEFKDQLANKLKEIEDKLASMDKACVTDQERQAIFKDLLYSGNCFCFNRKFFIKIMVLNWNLSILQ